MRNFFLGIVAGFALLVSAAVIFVLSGGMPVATKGEPLPFERWIAKKALHAAVKEDADKQAPFAATEAHLLAGAKLYERHCNVCHGLPNQDATAISAGLFPRPPRFFEHLSGGSGASGGSGGKPKQVGVTYWKIKNGIRLTGMPGFTDNLTEQELWEVTLFLANLKDLPAAVTKELTSDD